MANDAPTNITNNYYNCSFSTTNQVPVIIPVAQATNVKTEENPVDKNTESFKAMIKQVAKEANQPEAVVEYIIKLMTDYEIQ